MSYKAFLQYLLPKHAISRLVAKLANSRLPALKNTFIKLYCKFYHINMTDALETNYLNYPTFNDFFTRALKPDARPIINKHNIIISPVDGVVWQIGKIDKNQLVYAKGRIFSLEQLLADSKEAFSFHHSNFVVLYLAPHNYHRFHMPLTGKLRSMRYIPGKLFSVSPKIAENIPDLFAKNERIVTVFDTFIGPMAMIFVGAIIVGSIETKWEGTITPNKTNNLINWNYSNRNIIFERGAEIGNFKLGSTVILLLPSKTTEWKDDLKANISIKMGQSLGKTLLNL